MSIVKVMESQGKQYYQLTKEEIFEKLSTSDQGLSDDEAKKRLSQYGYNRITSKKKISALDIYIGQFKNTLTLILIASSVLILFIYFLGEREQSDLIEAGLILAIVLMITLLGFIQEYKAEKSIEALKKLLAFKAKVRRSGSEKEIDVSEIVPGDIVVLEEGEKMPADVRLFQVFNLSVIEASLTGESTPVNKNSDAISEKKEISDQRNMAFSGTSVASGRGMGIVVATGDKTEIGKIANYVAETKEEQTPIQKRLDQIGKYIGISVLGTCVIVFIFIMFLSSEFSDQAILQRVIHSFIASVALAVAAIPEGLPAVVTIALALGTQRMLRKNTLVRKLNSVETLGSVDVICSDKTGTLTKGEMTVKEIFYDGGVYEVSGTGYETEGEFKKDGNLIDSKGLSLLLEIGVYCNNAHLAGGSLLGDPTEIALLVSAAKAKLSAPKQRIHEIPFDSQRKMMTVVIKDDEFYDVYTKGAPEIALSHCKKIIENGKEVDLSDDKRKLILEKNHEMSSKALRNLGFAYKKKSEQEYQQQLKDGRLENDLVFVGLQGMIDPPRVEVKPLISQCHASGIRVIMITGDHVDTAKAVAKEIGITGDATSGEELDKLSDDEFGKAVERVSIYARVNPGFKMRIVEALKVKGHIVAMTGDGVNDAPALKRADIGIAMGITGTDVSKEASDMVLLDDHFSSIVAAIEEGRGIFHNIRKFVQYLLTCNIGEVILVFLAVIFFHHVPLSATMLLWINVVTDGLPAIALGMDPAEKGIMGYRPRTFQSEIIEKRMWIEMIILGFFIAVLVLVLYMMNISYGIEKARGVAFASIVFFEMVQLFLIRSTYKTPLFSNKWLLLAVFTSIIMQILIIFVPFLSKLFEVERIDMLDFFYIGLFAILLGVMFFIVRSILDHIFVRKIESA